VNEVTVEMGRCTFVAPEIPMNGPEREVVKVPLQVADRTLIVTAVSVGNPHCVVFTDALESARRRHFADLTPMEVTGKAAEVGLDRAFLTCNKNSIPFDPLPPTKTSGIRLGSPAATTRGFGPAEFRKVGGLIAEVLEGMRRNDDLGDAQVEESVRRRVSELCEAFPVYPGR